MGDNLHSQGRSQLSSQKALQIISMRIVLFLQSTYENKLKQKKSIHKSVRINLMSRISN